MRLDEYQWSHNPRGLHNYQGAVRTDRWIGLKCGWAKLVAVDREHIPNMPILLANNITPIIRIYKPHFGAGVPTSDMVKAWNEYYQAGVRWFEFYNEPNFELEWPIGTVPSYTDINGSVGPLMNNWMDWAELIISMGAYPAFPALGEATGGTIDMSLWLIACLQYLSDNAYDRFRTIANSGLWLATHPYYYNHCYQEDTGPLKPRDPGNLNAEQGGWHFEYPFDPITQSYSPGLSPVSGPPEFPNGDPLGLTGMGYAFMKRFGDMFGGGAIPVVGTEGGSTLPRHPWEIDQIDNRFPPVTWNSQAEVTVASFNWIATNSPPWMFGLNLWKEDDYFDTVYGAVPAVNRLAQTNPIMKPIEPIEALAGPGPGPHGKLILTGPGPVHGTPDYHFIIVAPGFDPSWLFDSGRNYWDMFRPTLLDSVDFIANLPSTKSLVATVVATPELSDYMTHQIKDRWPNVYLDMIIVSDAQTITDILQQRVTSGRQFG